MHRGDEAIVVRSIVRSPKLGGQFGQSAGPGALGVLTQQLGDELEHVQCPARRQLAQPLQHARREHDGQGFNAETECAGTTPKYGHVQCEDVLLLEGIGAFYPHRPLRGHLPQMHVEDRGMCARQTCILGRQEGVSRLG